ncbi:glycosyltransferase [Albimonas pacifica]|nr:glycosyltransferase [Albimonas pacifica]
MAVSNVVAERPATRSLRRPVHFVCPPDQVWPELLDGAPVELSMETLLERSLQNVDCWVSRVCYELRRAGCECTYATQTRRGAINVCDAVTLRWTNRGVRPYVMIARGDKHWPMLANFVASQNRQDAGRRNGIFIPIWLQAGILPRDPARGAAIRKLSFKGWPANLYADFRSDSFRAALAERGVDYDIGVEAFRSGRPNWADYRDCDLVIAVRNLTEFDIRTKPGSKLVNAWWGETPALLGPEPAYAEMRRSELDYIEVRTVEDALAAIDRLIADPELYAAMVENGRVRRREWTDELFRDMWIDALNGVVAADFEAWERRSGLSRVAWVAVRSVKEQVSRRRRWRRTQSGPRVLDAPPSAPRPAEPAS